MNEGLPKKVIKKGQEIVRLPEETRKHLSDSFVRFLQEEDAKFDVEYEKKWSKVISKEALEPYRGLLIFKGALGRTMNDSFFPESEKLAIKFRDIDFWPGGTVLATYQNTVNSILFILKDIFTDEFFNTLSAFSSKIFEPSAEAYEREKPRERSDSSPLDLFVRKDEKHIQKETDQPKLNP